MQKKETMNPNITESIVTKYATTIEENKQKRKLKGQYVENEPHTLIFDKSFENFEEYDEDGNYTPFPNWEHTNLISNFCVMDIFGEDYHTIQKLLLVYPLIQEIEVKDDNGNGWYYYREIDIIRVIEILQTLAKTDFVNILRPNYTFIKDDEPVYSSEDMMNILGIKAELLRKFRKEGYLSYTQYPNSDKVWYTKKNLEEFLNNPIATIKAWNNKKIEY